MSFSHVAVIGLGLLGGSIGLAVRQHLPGVATTGYDSDPQVRVRAAERGLADTICETAAEAVAGADLVILCVPVGAMEEAGREIAGALATRSAGQRRRLVEAGPSAARWRRPARPLRDPGAPVAPANADIGPDSGFASLSTTVVHRHPRPRGPTRPTVAAHGRVLGYRSGRWSTR